ncbi:Increased DNA methylation 1 [Glycine soja]
MAPPTKPPPINIEPENCPEAVMNWYNITSRLNIEPENYKRQCTLSRDLSSQAKKHLCFLGWRFWHADKKNKWELRYTSPITGKNYISLRRACHACIQEGGCNNGNPQINLQQHNNNNNVDQNPSPSAPKKPRKSNNKRTRVCKKRQKSDDDDELGEASSFMNNNNYKKMMREAEATNVSDQSLKQQHRGAIIPWLIDNNVVALYSLVFCRDANNVVKKGKLWRSGIACECCGMFFSPTRFEAHAGCHKHRPNASIFLEDGRSLLDCQKEALSSQQNKVRSLIKEEEEEEKDHCEYQNDSICAICYFGGELVLCDRCPSSFHLSCLGLEHVPDGDWFCPACCCKVCKGPRCNTEENCDDHVDANRVLVCDQCEGRYHIGCLKALTYTKMGKDQDHVDNENENWFCSGDCENIFLALQKLVGKAINVVGEDNVTWTLLKALKKGESKLSEALNVLRECFSPVTDAFFGRDIISDVVFSRGSELNRLNFCGFYTVILEREGEVVSVATLRIFGKRVAEIPFVATRVQCRKQGLCGILMNEIEKQLTYLGVEEIVLPSTPKVIDTWTNSFDFEKMTLSVKSKFLDHVFLDFEDTILCHKLLVVKQTVI